MVGRKQLGFASGLTVRAVPGTARGTTDVVPALGGLRGLTAAELRQLATWLGRVAEWTEARAGGGDGDVRAG
jgi:hypothetical protein